MAKTSNTLLNSSGETGHPCLVPDFRGNAFSLFPLRIMFAVGLSYMTFIMLRFAPSIPAFWRIFYHKWVLNFVKGFLCIYWDNHMVFTFQSVNPLQYSYLENPMDRGIWRALVHRVAKSQTLLKQLRMHAFNAMRWFHLRVFCFFGEAFW